MKTDDSIFSRRELRAAAGLIALYAAVAIGAQALTPEDRATPSVHLRPPVTASAVDAAVGVADAVPLPSPSLDQVSTG